MIDVPAQIKYPVRRNPEAKRKYKRRSTNDELRIKIRKPQRMQRETEEIRFTKYNLRKEII